MESTQSAVQSAVLIYLCINHAYITVSVNKIFTKLILPDLEYDPAAYNFWEDDTAIQEIIPDCPCFTAIVYT